MKGIFLRLSDTNVASHMHLVNSSRYECVIAATTVIRFQDDLVNNVEEHV